jgi:hypothetical protein
MPRIRPSLSTDSRALSRLATLAASAALAPAASLIRSKSKATTAWSSAWTAAFTSLMRPFSVGPAAMTICPPDTTGAITTASTGSSTFALALLTAVVSRI